MKLILEQWRHFINEQEPDDEVVVIDDFETIKDLKAALDAIARGKKISFGGRVLKSFATAGLSAVAGTGTEAVFDFLRQASLDNPTLAKSNPILDALGIDPFVSRVVDDNLEKEFIKFISSEIDGKGPEERLDDMNMTNLLTKYIARDYDDTVVKPPGR
jgi:hypothetical protein